MASVPNPSLDAGLSALNRGDYSIAIAHLEGVCETELDDSIVTRASQALIRAYQGNADAEKAIALCQQLAHHPDPKIREWASSTVTDLTTGDGLQVEKSLTQRRAAQVQASNPSSNLQPATPSEQTGFVAFNPTPSKPKTPSRGTPSPTKQRVADSSKRPVSEQGQRHRPDNASEAPSDAPELANAALSQHSQANSQSPTDNYSPQPVRSSPAPNPHPSRLTARPRWRNSERAQKWSPLKAPKLLSFWFIQIVTAIAFFWVLRFVVRFLMQTTNTILVKLPVLEPFQPFYQDPTPTLGILVAILLIASPWLFDGLLKWFHGFQVLPLTQLASRSPEAARVVQRLCRQRRLPLPKLGILPTDAPVALTYGNLPRTARIVVSEGLLSQLADDEIATIYASQLGHILNRDFVLMSLGVLIIQIPYLIYWQVAQWGEQLSNVIERKLSSSRQFLCPIVLGITGVVASISYGIYWILRLPLLWFSKARVYYSDRLSAETTGNPNGMTRALLKIGLGIAEDIENERKTSALLERFDLFLPVGYQQAILLGSCSSGTFFEDVLTWDCANPYREGLILTASHPLLGDRLHLLARYAQFWKLDSELDLPPLTPSIRDNKARLSKLVNSYKALPLLQSAVLFGVVLGVIFRAILWLIGQISDRLNIWQLIWMHNADPFLNACMFIAFSLCLFMWINGYFPDIKPATAQTEPDLGDLFANPDTLPPDSQPVQLSGKLLGRRGLLNWLAQDLILQTSTGLVKLHYWSFLGPFGNILPLPQRPSNLIDQQVTITGWFRRGVTPWIDIDTLRTHSGKVIRANYPIWVTLLAVVAALWGAYLIWEA